MTNYYTVVFHLFKWKYAREKEIAIIINAILGIFGRESTHSNLFQEFYNKIILTTKERIEFHSKLNTTYWQNVKSALGSVYLILTILLLIILFI